MTTKYDEDRNISWSGKHGKLTNGEEISGHELIDYETSKTYRRPTNCNIGRM